MDNTGTEAVIEVETGINSKGLHFMIRESDGGRRLLAEFRLDPAAFFALVNGGVRRVVGRRGDLDKGDRITQLLDRLTSEDGEETDRSTEELVQALESAFRYPAADDDFYQLRVTLGEEMA